MSQPEVTKPGSPGSRPQGQPVSGTAATLFPGMGALAGPVKGPFREATAPVPPMGDVGKPHSPGCHRHVRLCPRNKVDITERAVQTLTPQSHEVQTRE